LGGQGISVRVSGAANCWGMFSRYCLEKFAIPAGVEPAVYWTDLLLGDNAQRLHGHMIFACSDEALEFLATQHSDLKRHYILDIARPELVLDLLDKRKTLEVAKAASIAVPSFWKVTRLADLSAIRTEITYPALVKPVHSHKFSQIFGEKLFVVRQGFAELEKKVSLALDHGLEVAIVEMIPGPDNLLSSYNAYITDDGATLFSFTKRVLRRYPVNNGNGCFHATAAEPEAARSGRQLFSAIGMRGFANVEFKRDPRDGVLKIIEVNSRFTAAHELMARAGIPIGVLIYCHLTQQPVPAFTECEAGLHLWYPLRDFLSFLQLRHRGEITAREWLGSIAGKPVVFPVFRWDDLWPMFHAGLSNAMRLARGHA
jgi:predicted ATP-grasp superfamily ATP-dependent carboligase